MTLCRDTMGLPQWTADGARIIVTLGCELEAPHPGRLHLAHDPDGIVRQWPAEEGPARNAALANLEEEP